MSTNANPRPTHYETESYYIRLAIAAVSRGDDDLACAYLTLAEEARRRAELHRRAVRAFLDAQAGGGPETAPDGA